MSSSTAPLPWSTARIGVLLLLLAITAGGSWLMQRLVAQHQQSRFEAEVQRVDYALSQRLKAYVQVLRGGLGLFAASDEVSRDDWREYVSSLQLQQRYPGIRQMSFVPAVRSGEVERFVARVRAEAIPEGLWYAAALKAYALHEPPPPIERVDTELHGPVLYTEPLTPTNVRSLGLDMMRDASRQASMRAAVQSGEAVLSGRLRLLSDEGTRVGFIAYLPVYRKDKWLGWLTAVFYADAFMSGLFGESGDPLQFEVFAGASTDADAQLYSSAGLTPDGAPQALSARGGGLERVAPLPLPGGAWTLRYVAEPGFVSVTDRLAPWLVACGGLLATLLFYAVARAGDQWRTQAALLARQAEELRAAEASVRHQATHDPLTGLANRALFMDRLHTARERAARRKGVFALGYLDIDGFKPVNDRHGHHVGDVLLKAIASRLLDKLRGEDTVARLGGDEFAIILEGNLEPPGLAERLCNEIIECLAAPYALGEHSVRIGASLGLALYPLDGADSESLIVAADKAMYRAKQGGKQRCVMAGAAA